MSGDLGPTPVGVGSGGPGSGGVLLGSMAGQLLEDLRGHVDGDRLDGTAELGRLCRAPSVRAQEAVSRVGQA
jgi:hypothetical protein